MSLNRCEFIGNLGADPEVRRMSSGDPVVNLRIAVTDRWTDRSSGEKRERTTWIPVVIFNENLAKVAEQYLKKGSKVFIAGEFSVRKWTDNSGQERYATEIVLQRYRGELQMLDGRGETQGGSRRTDETQGGYRKGRDGDDFGDLNDEINF